MTAYSSHVLKKEDSIYVGKTIKIQGTGFDKSTKINAFITDENYKPLYNTVNKN